MTVGKPGVFLICLTASVGVALAEPEPAPELMRLTLDEAVSIALESNRDLLIAEEERIKAQGQITEARAEALPSLKASTVYTHLGDVPSASFGGTSVSLGEQDTYTIYLNLAQTIYEGGKVWSAIRAANLYSHYARERLRQARQKVIYDARAAYFDLLINREFTKAEEETLRLARENLRDVQKKLAQEVVPRFDELRAKVEVANVEARLLQTTNLLHLSSSKFLKVLGLPLDTRFELADSLTYREQEVQADAAMATALDRRPELRQAELMIRTQQENLNVVRSSLRPKLDVAWTWEGGNSTRFSFGGSDWSDGWTISANATLDIFDGFRTRGRLRKEQAVLDQYKLTRDDLAEMVKLELTQALLSLEDSRKFVESQRENVAQAEEGLRLARARYDSGLGTQLEITDAQVALEQSRKNLCQAVYNHNLAVLNLAKAKGTLGEEGPM